MNGIKFDLLTVYFPSGVRFIKGQVEIYRYLDLSLQRKEQLVGGNRHVKNVIGVSPSEEKRRRVY